MAEGQAPRFLMAMAKIIPIQSVEAEQAVLGAILVRPEALDPIMSLLEPGDFYRQAHVQIFQAMMDLQVIGRPVDLVTVTVLLRERGQLDQVGGPAFLGDLSEQSGFATNAMYYAEKVREKSQRRKLKGIAKEISDNSESADIWELLQYADSRIYEIQKNSIIADQVIPGDVFLSKIGSQKEDIIGNGILPSGANLMIAGESGEGKSLFRTELAIHLALGWDCWNLDIPKPRKVMIIQFENTDFIEQYRLKKMLSGLGVDNCPPDLMFCLPSSKIDLGDKKDLARLQRIIEKHKADVVVYDPLTSLHQVNENDNPQMRGILDNLSEINRKTGAASIVVHHYGKPTAETAMAHRTRGASSIRDWCDTLIGVSRGKGEAIVRTLDFIKVRNGPEPKRLVLERSKENFLHTVTDDADVCPPEKVRAILASLGGCVEGQERLRAAIMAEVGCKERRARHFINQAVDRGSIICEDHPADSRKKIYRQEDSGN